MTSGAASSATPSIPCPECGGGGLLHCCEGLIEQSLPCPASQVTGVQGRGEGDAGQPDLPRG
jgi:hypothetical protein